MNIRQIFLVPLLLLIIVFSDSGHSQKQQVYNKIGDVQLSWELSVCNTTDFERNFLREFTSDSAGNVYGTAACGNATSGTDIYIVIITNNGALEWKIKYLLVVKI